MYIVDDVGSHSGCVDDTVMTSLPSVADNHVDANTFGRFTVVEQYRSASPRLSLPAHVASASTTRDVAGDSGVTTQTATHLAAT